MISQELQGKVILVTGSNSGIGKATALGLANLGATVVMHSRGEKRGEPARRDVIAATDNPNVHLLTADLSTREAMKGLAEAFNQRYPKLDVLVNNAAVVTNSRKTTAEGFELQFFVNHLAYFYLTHLFLDALRAAGSSEYKARIVNVASTAHSRGVIDFDDLQHERNYIGFRAYSNTKLQNIMFTYELARRLGDQPITANCLHPGVIKTGLMRNNWLLHSLWMLAGPLFKQPKEGADTSIYLASSSEVEGVTGKYFKYRREVGTKEISHDRDVQRRLWEESENLLGIQSPLPPAS